VVVEAEDEESAIDKSYDGDIIEGNETAWEYMRDVDNDDPDVEKVIMSNNKPKFEARLQKSRKIIRQRYYVITVYTSNGLTANRSEMYRDIRDAQFLERELNREFEFAALYRECVKAKTDKAFECLGNKYCT